MSPNYSLYEEPMPVRFKTAENHMMPSRTVIFSRSASGGESSKDSFDLRFPYGKSSPRKRQAETVKTKSD